MDTTDKQVVQEVVVVPPTVEFPLHSLENGFIRYVDKPRPTFHLYGLKGEKPIYLNSKELIQLARELPKLDVVADEARATVAANPETPDGMLFSKVLYKSPTSTIKLSVDLYKGKPYIWVRRFFATEADPTDLQPCKGGTYFGSSDKGEDILKFTQQCLFR